MDEPLIVPSNRWVMPWPLISQETLSDLSVIFDSSCPLPSGPVIDPTSSPAIREKCIESSIDCPPRRIEIADRKIPGSLQPYHAAEELPFPRAKELLKLCEAGSARLAHKAVGDLTRDLTARGYRIAGCGLLLASGRSLPRLESVLASHALIHAADGEHFRHALMRAAKRHSFSVLRLPERELYATAAKRFRTTADALQAGVNAAGKPLGPPWTADQKLAALVAWLVLAR